jgi:hypothetical protein
MTQYFTSVGLGVVLALGILWLVRRDRLHGSYALWWLLIAAGALLIGFYPGLVDWIGVKLGVAYPPMLLAMVAIIAVLLKLLGVDIDVTRRERRVRRLVQKVAILELELRQLREQQRTEPGAEPRAEPPAPAPLPADAGEARRRSAG